MGRNIEDVAKRCTNYTDSIFTEKLAYHPSCSFKTRLNITNAMLKSAGKAREYKILLGAISVIVGLISFYFLAVSSYGLLKGLIFGFVVSVLYPLFAALSVKAILRLFKFALIWDKNYSWSMEYQTIIGSFWPITLPIALVMGFYSSIINRLFREH
jgi:hypothetical protein